MAAIIDAVQTGLWQEGVHDLLGYSTDYAFGQNRGLQTLVLKSKHRSAYVRLQWDTVMGDSAEHRQLVDDAIRNSINQQSRLTVARSGQVRPGRAGAWWRRSSARPPATAISIQFANASLIRAKLPGAAKARIAS